MTTLLTGFGFTTEREQHKSMNKLVSPHSVYGQSHHSVLLPALDELGDCLPFVMPSRNGSVDASDITEITCLVSTIESRYVSPIFGHALKSNRPVRQKVW